MCDIKKLEERLKKLANRECWGEEEGAEDFVDASDYSGGNFDDAYSGGIDDGQTQLAREVLAVVFPSNSED